MESLNNNKLVEVKNESIFSKIKNFIKNLFSSKEKSIIDNTVKEEDVKKIEKSETVQEKDKFTESIKNYENKDNDIIVLKNLYHEGKISVKELTDEQLERICEFYDEQIFRIKESNERRKAKLLEYRNTKMKKV